MESQDWKGTAKPSDDQAPFFHLLTLIIEDKEGYRGNNSGMQLGMDMRKLDLQCPKGKGRGDLLGPENINAQPPVLVFLGGPAREDAGRFPMQHMLHSWSASYLVATYHILRDRTDHFADAKNCIRYKG